MISLRRRLAEVDHFLLVARLTLVMVVVNANEQPVAFAIAIAASLVLFLAPRALRSPWPWLSLAAALGGFQLAEWYRVDDHVTVSTYWLIALGLSRFGDDPRAVAATAARALIACVFTLAFAWKVLSSQFVTGDFFRYQLVADDRFALVSEVAGGTSETALAADRAAIRDAAHTGGEGARVPLAEGPRQSALASVFTLWGIVVEGAVAAAFALPLRRWHRLRLATLLAFAFTTYAVVPVAGFGALLMTLVLATHDGPRTRPVIVGGFALVLAWGAVFPLLL